ncbi:uncharacterized [Tachysurus ichikawai]
MSRNEPVCLSKVICLGTEASVSCRLWLELLMFKEDRVRDWPRICLRNGFARMFPLLCLQDGQELANQSAGCISLLEIAVKNQLPDCAAVNRDWQRRAEWRRCCHRSLPPEKEPVHRTCAVLSVSGSVCVAGAVSPGATPPTL